jgi:xanthine dehydrogenase accessory factor
MSELTPLLEALVADARSGRQVALCTVVKTKGSTPRRAGAAMLVREDGSTLGTLGGGITEANVVRRASNMLHKASEPALLEYGLDQETAAEEGSVCGGRMFITATPVTSETDLQPYENALASLRRRQSTYIPLLVEHEGRQLEYRLHLEVPPALLIAGAGHVGQAIAKLAGGLGFHVVVIDDRAEFASPQRFGDRAELIVGDVTDVLTEYPLDPSCYVVIATRGHRNDLHALEAVIGRPTAYVGMIGSQRKIRMVFEELKKVGVSQERLDTVHTPIGVPIGAETVPEIAVSIAAELIQARRKTVPKLVEGPFPSPGVSSG